MTPDPATAKRIAALSKRLDTLRGFRAACKEEASGAVGGELFDLTRELRNIERELGKVQAEIFRLEKRIKRELKARECKCPTCQRYLPAGTVLSEGLIERLKAASAAGTTTATEK